MKPYINNIYKHSPVWFQNLMVSVYGYIIYKQRYGATYRNTYKALIKKKYTNYKKEVKQQEFLLQQFINSTVINSNYYRNLYKGIDLKKIKTIKDLELLPIVSKEEFKANIKDIYTLDESKAITVFTGGTTGRPLKIVFSKEDFQKRMAYLDAFKYRVGIKNIFKVKKATFNGRDLIGSNKTKVFWRNNIIYKQRLYSTFHLNEKNAPYYVNNLNRFQPEIINGFVSAIYEISDFIFRNNLKLEFKPKAIFTTSETLLPFHRKRIEEVFNAPVYNQYASGEGATFITECIHRNLHYNLDTGVIESLKTKDGNQMLITSFTTSGTPLIRYNIEDCITFIEGECECGSKHPLVKIIEGRKVDYLYFREKGKVSLSHLADVIKELPNSVKNMQFVQKNIDCVTAFLVIDKELFLDSDKDKIVSKLRERFGESAKIDLKIVDQISRAENGKYMLIENEMLKSKLN